EFRDLVEAVRLIEHLGRRKRQLMATQEGRAFGAVANDIQADVDSNATGRKKPLHRTRAGAWERSKRYMKAFGLHHVKVGTWVRVMHGGRDGGPLWNYLVRPANQRGH